MTVKQAANVLDLLEYFAQHRQPASLADISKHFGWPRSSTFNLLTTLAGRGYLYEPRAREGYFPTPMWEAQVNAFAGSDPIPQRVLDLLERLVRLTNETAVLAATSGMQAVFLTSVESPNAIRYTAPKGKRVPLHLTATGRALLSMMSAAERSHLLRRAKFERFTPTTLMSVAAIDDEIAKSSERGWFAGNAEFTSDLGGVAVAISISGRHCAVLVAGPMFRLHSLDALGELLVHEASQIISDDIKLMHANHSVKTTAR